METYNNLCINYSSNWVSLSWRTKREDLPFNLSFSVKWRGITIPFQIKTNKTELGCTTKIAFLYDGKNYVIRFTTWKYLMGGHGDQLPKIGNSTHTLRIRHSLGFLEMKESLLEPSFSEDNDISPFKLLLFIKQNNEKMSDDIDIRNC